MTYIELHIMSLAQQEIEYRFPKCQISAQITGTSFLSLKESWWYEYPDEVFCILPAAGITDLEADSSFAFIYFTVVQLRCLRWSCSGF